MTKAQSLFNRQYEHFRDLVLVLTQKDLKVRYKSSTLGYLWSIAHPLALAFVFVIAFKVVMRIQMENYALFLIMGLFPWQWFSNSATIPANAFLSNASMIKKVNFPRSIIPFSLVLQDMIHYLLSIPVILFFMLLYHKAPGWSWLYAVPILLIIQFCLCFGFALAVSSINLFFRDLERLATLFSTLMFYFTPVLYPLDMVPENFRLVIQLNPLTPLMLSWRNLFLHNQVDWSMLLMASGFALVILLAGYAVYRKLAWKFAEVL